MASSGCSLVFLEILCLVFSANTNSLWKKSDVEIQLIVNFPPHTVNCQPGQCLVRYAPGDEPENTQRQPTPCQHTWDLLSKSHRWGVLAACSHNHTFTLEAVCSMEPRDIPNSEGGFAVRCSKSLSAQVYHLRNAWIGPGGGTSWRLSMMVDCEANRAENGEFDAMYAIKDFGLRVPSQRSSWW